MAIFLFSSWLRAWLRAWCQSLGLLKFEQSKVLGLITLNTSLSIVRLIITRLFPLILLLLGIFSCYRIAFFSRWLILFLLLSAARSSMSVKTLGYFAQKVGYYFPLYALMWVIFTWLAGLIKPFITGIFGAYKLGLFGYYSWLDTLILVIIDMNVMAFMTFFTLFLLDAPIARVRSVLRNTVQFLFDNYPLIMLSELIYSLFLLGGSVLMCSLSERSLTTFSSYFSFYSMVLLWFCVMILYTAWMSTIYLRQVFQEGERYV